MNNVTEQLEILQNYCVVSGDGSILENRNRNYIIEKYVQMDSTSCAQNNSAEKEHYGSENVCIPANECNLENEISNGKSEMNEGRLKKKMLQVENIFCIDNIKQEYSVTISNGFQEVPVDVSNGFQEGSVNISNGFQEGLVNVSNGFQEGLVNVSNGFQEGSVDVSNGFQEGSVDLSNEFQEESVNVSNGQYFEQPLEYQDLNLIYTENSTTLHVCDVCGKSFRKKSNLKRHYRSHTGDNPHACHVHQCEARFPTMSGLKEHLLSHTGLRPHACKICGKAFSRVSNLRRHCRTHSAEKPYQCDKCAIRFVEPNRLREHYLTHVGEKRFSCDVCGKCFLKKFNLKRHCRTHTGDHPHSCKTCGRGFSKRIYLLVHMDTHAKDRSKFETEADSAIKTVASNCIVESAEDAGHEKSSWPDVLIDNIYSANDPEDKIFSCELCSRYYIKESSLMNHMKRHNKVLLTCEVCDATFTHASRLREHLVSHSGEKPFACFQCKRCFGRNSNLLRHIATHTGERRFMCNLCKHRFSSSANLKEHLTLHSGEMPHRCEVCGKGFRHKSGLRRHLLLHTGEKPHKCAACGKKFNRRGRLLHHCERHHSPKFPNRVEPRLMNIIQNLEARLCEPIKPEPSSDDQQSSKKRNHNKREDGTKTKRKSRKTLSETLGSSEEYEELTVEVTTADAGDFSTNLHNGSLQKCARKNLTKPDTRSCKSKLLRSELKSKNTNSLKKKSRRNLRKAIVHYSKEKASTNQTLESDISKHDSSRQIACDNHNKHGNLQCAENNVEQVNETSEQIEIDDVSAYQTQVLGNDLDTIILIKAAL